MEPKTVAVLDDQALEEELKRMEEAHPGFVFDRSFAFDRFYGGESDLVFDFDPDESVMPSLVRSPEVEEMRMACASGDLESVQSIHKTHWIDRPSHERIDKHRFGASGLCEAIKLDNASIASYLLSHLVSMEECHFAMATEHHSYSILQLYLDRGWNINTPLGLHKPPALSLAIKDEQLTKWFLSKGADPNAACGLDITPLSIAIRDASLDTIEFLFANGGSIEYGQLLHYAACRTRSDSVKIIECLLNKGAMVNALLFQNSPESYEQERYSGLGTPLHSAVRSGRLDNIDVLISNSADALIKDSMGRLPIEIAEYRGLGAVTARLYPLSKRPAEVA